MNKKRKKQRKQEMSFMQELQAGIVEELRAQGANVVMHAPIGLAETLGIADALDADLFWVEGVQVRHFSHHDDGSFDADSLEPLSFMLFGCEHRIDWDYCWQLAIHAHLGGHHVYVAPFGVVAYLGDDDLASKSAGQARAILLQLATTAPAGPVGKGLVVL